MVKPTPPTAPEAPLRSDPAFSTKAQTFLTWLSGGFYSYVEDSVDFVDERADEALAAATTFGFPSIAGKALNLTRVNAAGTALEFRTPAQVRSDIGATAVGASVFTAADAAAARSAIGAMVQPTNAAGLGQVTTVYAGPSTIFSAPAGGQRWGRFLRRNNTTLGVIAQSAGVYNGGTNILTLGAGEDCTGDFIRIA
jgi:hypothetical protein